MILALLAGCNNGGFPVEAYDLEAEVSDAVATVVTVTWTTSEPITGYVVAGDVETPPETEPTQSHRAVLRGLAPDTTYDVYVQLDNGGNSEVVQVTTGPLPAELPELAVTGDGNDAWMAVPIIGSIAAPVLLRPDGQISWYHVDDRGLDVYRVRPSVDGESMLYNAASVSGDPADDSVIVRVAWDGSSEEEIVVPLLAHDFVEHPDGTIAAIVVEYREVDGEQLRGDSILEIHPDGTQTKVWTSWDCFDPAVHTGDEPDDWTFANALDYDAEAQVYTLGMRNFSSIARIDRATGACGWVLGDEAATVTFAGGSSPFMHQHQFDLLGDPAAPTGIVVFDNEGSGETASRVQEYTLDLAAGTATEVWSYTADPAVYSFVLGDVTRLDDGDTLITWSVGGQIERVSPAGDSTWKVNTGVGSAFGFDTVLASPY